MEKTKPTLDRSINGTRNDTSNMTNAAEVTTEINRKAFSSISYVPKLTEALAKQLKYFIPDVMLAPRPMNKNSRFFSNMKARINKEDKAGCVYQIDCADCDKIYIGETIQKLSKRIEQHVSDCANLDRKSTALAAHTKALGHRFEFGDARILCRERYKSRLRIQEVNHIIANDHRTCNFKTDNTFVSPLYYSLLKQ